MKNVTDQEYKELLESIQSEETKSEILLENRARDEHEQVLKRNKQKNNCHIVNLEMNIIKCNENLSVMRSIKLHSRCFISFYVRECFYFPFIFIICTSFSSLYLSSVASLSISLSTCFSLTLVHYSVN